MTPKMWERINIKWRKSYIGGGSKLAGKVGQFSTGIFNIILEEKVMLYPKILPHLLLGYEVVYMWCCLVTAML